MTDLIDRYRGLEPPPSIANLQVLGSHELDGQLGESQHARVDKFRSVLEQAVANGYRVVDLSRLEADIPDDAKPTNHQLVKLVQEQTGGVVLSPEYKGLRRSGYSDFHIIRTPGAESSAHQVFFGVLHKPGNTAGGLSVAVKPCETNPNKAITDWVNGSLIRRTDPRAYAPVGFVVGDQVGYSITHFKPEGFDTLESTSWSRVLRDMEDNRFDGQRQLLRFVAESLANIHGDNVFHGDPQFKNIVLDPTGEVYFIDWESADFYAHDPNQQTLTNKMTHDLKVLFCSMATPESAHGVGLLDGFTTLVQWSYFKEHFLDSYIEQYLKGANPEERQFEAVAQVEADMQQYILDGELYKSHARNHTHLR
jgi:tRNA A-37 threonylcarbamoyl transferase component Bud32